MDLLVDDMAEKRISELKGTSVETSKTEKQREQQWKRTEYPRTMNNYKRCNICVMGIKEQKKYLKQ